MTVGFESQPRTRSSFGWDRSSSGEDYDAGGVGGEASVKNRFSRLILKSCNGGLDVLF